MQILFRDCPIIFLEQEDKIKFVLASFSFYLEILWKNVLSASIIIRILQPLKCLFTVRKLIKLLCLKTVERKMKLGKIKIDGEYFAKYSEILKASKN